MNDRAYRHAATYTMTNQTDCRPCAWKILAALCALTGWSVTAAAQVQPGAIEENRPASVDACALLSPATVSEATGFPANAGIRRDSGYESNGAYSSTCVWLLERDGSDTGHSGSLGGRSYVILNVMRWPDGSGLADSFLQAFREAAAAGEIPSMPTPRDFGDAALWWGDGLAVRSGDVSFGLSVVMPGAESSQPGELEGRLAPAILQGLELPAG